MKGPAALLMLTLVAPFAVAEGAVDTRPPAMREIGFTQRLGERVPLDLAFRDETGRAVRLRDLFGKGRPVVLSLVYYECPLLCTLTQNGLLSALGVLTLSPAKDFEIVTVSFDPRETPEQASARKKAYVERYGHPGAEAGWHFLTGEREALTTLTEAVGFRYSWDAETRQFAHPAGLVVLTPEGVISRYLYGIEYAPKDLRLALIESAAGRLGTAVDSFLLTCYRYDPVHGRYGAAVMNLLRMGAVATMLVLGGFVGIKLRRERARAAGRT